MPSQEKARQRAAEVLELEVHDWVPVVGQRPMLP
jgi:hypothetical protein